MVKKTLKTNKNGNRRMKRDFKRTKKKENMKEKNLNSTKR